MKKISFAFLGVLALAAATAHAEKTEHHYWAQPVPYSEPKRDLAVDPVPATEPDAVPEKPAAKRPAARTETSPGPAPANAPERWLADTEADSDRVRFDVGVRCLGIWLTEDRKGSPHRGSFIGSIYKLKAKQNIAPIHPYAQVTFALGGGWRLGGGATFSHVAVETLDNGGGDGDIKSNALMGYLVAERDAGRFRPYAEAGGGISFNSFDAASDWGGDGSREFDLENSPALFAGAGCAVGLVGGLSLDAHVRYVHCDVDGTYIYKRDNRGGQDFTFTTSYVAAGVGLSYAF